MLARDRQFRWPPCHAPDEELDLTKASFADMFPDSVPEDPAKMQTREQARAALKAQYPEMPDEDIEGFLNIQFDTKPGADLDHLLPGSR